MKWGVLTIIAILGLQGCGVPDGALIHSCEPASNMTPVCGLQSPEDIEVLPGNDFLLLSEYGSMGERSGQIVRFNVNDNSHQAIFPVPTPLPATLAGDPACTQPPGPEFSPHGSHLVQLKDGSWRYLAVNHGGREAVELFALVNDAEGLPHLHWQGCVPAAENTLINDVVGLSNGDVVFSRMYNPKKPYQMALASLFAVDTGDVWYWSRADGLRRLPNTVGSLTNGVQISADERFVFINQYMNEEVHKYDLATQEVVAVAKGVSADNSAWAPNGELWLATHDSDMRTLFACFNSPQVACGLGFEIVALNPETMALRRVFKHRGAPMGAATVAVANRGKVYFGTFVGDRMAISSIDEFTP